MAQRALPSLHTARRSSVIILASLGVSSVIDHLISYFSSSSITFSSSPCNQVSKPIAPLSNGIPPLSLLQRQTRCCGTGGSTQAACTFCSRLLTAKGKIILLFIFITIDSPLKPNMLTFMFYGFSSFYSMLPI